MLYTGGGAAPSAYGEATMEETNRALLTDLYELTMAAAYFESGMQQKAAFEMFVREMPPGRSFLVSAGLEQVVSYLENLRFLPEQINYLRSLDVFKTISDGFWDYLEGFRFTGDLEAMPEGTLVFAGEPILVVRGPIIEAQIVETFLLTSVNYQTLVASKAARVVWAATQDGVQREVADFGSRRAHGPEAGVLAARASYIGGCAATSNVEAGFRLGIPVTGTQAHSFIMAFDSEEEAFRRYYESFPDSCVLLIDTYDVIGAAGKAVEIAPGMSGVRIDSGNIGALSRKVRKMLDDAGLEEVAILLSGDLNEYRIAELLASGARADGFGVGTDMVTSRDAPALGGVYKLVALEKDGQWTPKFKLSPEKSTYPGCKQVYRMLDPKGERFACDLIAAQDEPPPEGHEPLLQPVIRAGKRAVDLPTLPDIRARARSQLARLHEKYKQLTPAETYPVRISRTLRQRRSRLEEELKGERG